MKITHIVTHTHRHGTSNYFVNFTGKGNLTEKKVIKACDIDFEPDREEFINIEKVSESEIVEIK